MPIFEYYCQDHHTLFRFFARRPGLDRKVPRCPLDPAHRLEKRPSVFAIARATDKAARPDGDGADGTDGDDLDPAMERAMAEMEREMSAMDQDNPDPRQLGRMMRRMADLTGEPLDGRMDEMIRRLEKGDDPESIEQDYGDLMDDDAAGDGAGDDATADPAGRLIRRLRRSGHRQPLRIDPELYELTDFLGRRAKAQ